MEAPKTNSPVILQELRAVQARFGFLPKEEIKAIADRLGRHLHHLHEVISFFPHFRLAPPPDVEILVCRDMACDMAGAPGLLARLESVAAEFGGDARVRVKGVSCLGQCDGAPAVLVELHRQGQSDAFRTLTQPSSSDHPTSVRKIIAAHLLGQEIPPNLSDHSGRRWLIDPYAPAAETISNPSDEPGSQPLAPRTAYAAVHRLAEELRQAQDSSARKAVIQSVIDTLKTSDLRGMGGAGRPVFTKWSEVWGESATANQVFVVCNGDESEPSTFKDREILARAPHLVIEGMTLGALVVGATRGYVYIRHEYPDQVHAVERELERCCALGIIGSNVLGTGQAFELEVFESPGGYVCGEQSALIEAIEEHRAEPRNRPPVIEADGLYGQPTLLNNVETFAWVPAIMTRGGAWYRDAGISDSPWYAAKRNPQEPPDRWARGKGLRFFSLCGDVTHPGVFEVPVGVTLGELIQMAGGMRNGRPFLALAPSGPSGGFLPGTITPLDLPAKRRRNFPAGRTEFSLLELPLDKAEYDALGFMLGAGLLVVAGREGVDPAAQMLELALNASRFFRNESCGKCVPCRVGSQKLVEIGEQLVESWGVTAQQAILFDKVRALQQAMEQTSICGLGTSASKPMASLFEHDWRGGDRSAAIAGPASM